ncbi:MAG TPA: secretin N-terminal domain-containing protein [Verrucomicrobiae bacterium]|jgi:general secretion pathway protein D|nr:secretin N-terminal domain-containing protein [Verrucomicrobiae bacterium]
MKKIASLLLLLGLVSCSQPKPAANFAPVEMSQEGVTLAQPQTVAPPTVAAAPAKQTSPETVAPAVPATKVAQAQPAIVPPPMVETNAAPSPFARPPQPTVPATTAPPVASAASPVVVTNTQPEPLLPELSVNFHAAPIDLVLQTYADFVHRTLLRSPNINAQTTVTLVQQNALTKTELVEALDAVLALNNIAMVPIGEKFVKVVPLADASGVGAKVNDMNASTLPEFGPFDTHIVQLKYTKPSEMVPILQQFTKTPAAVLPIEGSGMVVLRDTAENVRVMLDIINRLDTAVPTEIESEVIPIKYALAADIANALNSLSGSGGGGGTFGGSSSGKTGSLGTSRTTGSGNARGFGSSSVGGGYNNGQVGQQGSVGGLGGGGGGLGASGGSASPSFTDRVKSLIARAGDSGKGEFQILGQTKIIADERMNALLVFASKDDMAMIKKVVKQLDVVLAQVLIEAIIMEVTLDNSRTIGVSAAQYPMGNNNTVVGGYNNGQSFFFPPGSSGGSNSFPGNVTSSLPGNMFSYFGNFGNKFQVSLQAAESEGRVNVLSRPRIQTSHGVEADLFVGETIPYVDSTTAGAFGGTGVYNSYQQQQIGITLKVKPLINPDGLVVMDIYQEASEPGPSSTAVNINGTDVPTINQRQASATVAVKDRDTIILGGMISTTQSKTKSGVPYLKDIPLLGNLFRSTANTEERVELIVLLRPTVLPTPEAASVLATAEQRRLPGVRRAEAEIRAEEALRLKQADAELKELERTNNVDMKDPFD